MIVTPWDIFLMAFLFVLGACVGSFLNVCIYRLPANLSIVWPPSHCPKCLHRIAWYDNLPIASYFVLRGRCRHCGASYSSQYMVVEALTGVLFAGYYAAYFVLGARDFAFARWDVYAVHMALVSALVVSSAIDFRTKEIFTSITNGGMVLGLALSVAFPALHVYAGSHGPAPFEADRLNALVQSATGLVVGGGIVWLTALLGRLAFKREAMGFGDVLLMGMMGSVLGWEAMVLVFFIAPFFGLFYGAWQLLRHKDHEVPYGPFLSMAAGVVMLLQTQIVAWFEPGIRAVWQALEGGQ